MSEHIKQLFIAQYIATVLDIKINNSLATLVIIMNFQCAVVILYICSSCIATVTNRIAVSLKCILSLTMLSCAAPAIIALWSTDELKCVNIIINCP